MLFQSTTESLVGGERLRRLVVHQIICTKKLVQNVLFAKDLPIRMIRISCKTFLSGNGNILTSRQQLFQACHFGENIFLQQPCLHNMRGLFLECIFVDEFILARGLHSILPPALQIPLERQDSKKNLKFHAKYRININAIVQNYWLEFCDKKYHAEEAK